MRIKQIRKDCAEYQNISVEEAIKIYSSQELEFDKNFPEEITEETLNKYYSENKFFRALIRKDHFKYNIIRDYVSITTSLQFSKLKKVLDFGCGSGLAAIRFANNGFDVTACDIEGENLKFAKWWGKKRAPNLKIIDLKEFNWNQKFDCILCFDVLEHIINPLETVKKLSNMIDNGGILFITTEFSSQKVEKAHINEIECGTAILRFLRAEGFLTLESINMPNGQKYKLGNYPRQLIKWKVKK